MKKLFLLLAALLAANLRATTTPVLADDTTGAFIVPTAFKDIGFTGTTSIGLTLKSLTTTQKNAVSPAATAGALVYDSTLGRTQMYDGAAWHTHVRLDGDTMTGALLFSTDNTLDLGASGATRPRTGYFGTSIVTPAHTAPTGTNATITGGDTGAALQVGQSTATRPFTYTPVATMLNSWTTSGGISAHLGATITNGSSAANATVASAVFHSFAAPSLAASNAGITTTDAANVYIAGGPTASGGNQTITNTWGLWNAGNTRLDGTLVFPGSNLIASNSSDLAFETGGNIYQTASSTPTYNLIIGGSHTSYSGGGVAWGYYESSGQPNVKWDITRNSGNGWFRFRRAGTDVFVINQNCSVSAGLLDSTANTWTTLGIQFNLGGHTYTNANTAASGTAATATFVSFAASTLAATNASVTTTDAATVYIGGNPTAGTNQTITNAWGLWNVGNTRLGGNLSLTTAGSAISIKSGTNALAGTVTLSSGAATITSTAIDVNTVLLLSLKTSSGTPGTYPPLATVAAGSATIAGLATDNSTYNWVALKVN